MTHNTRTTSRSTPGGDGPLVLVLHEPSPATELATEIERRLPDVDVVIATPDRVSPETLSAATVVLTFTADPIHEHRSDFERLEWVHALTSGVDDYDVEELSERDVLLTNASGIAARPIAEQVLAYMLSFERQLHRGIRQQERDTWEWYGGRELRDRTVAIVGVGAIGSRVAELCSALGLTVLGVKRDLESVPPAVDDCYPADRFHEPLGRADYAVISCPLNEQTRGMFGASAFEEMRRHGVLVNVARGGIVDESALVDAIQGGGIRGAALDVFDEEPLPPDSALWELDDVILTPHMAGSTPHYWDRNAELFAENYRRFLAGRRDEFVNRVL